MSAYYNKETERQARWEERHHANEKLQCWIMALVALAFVYGEIKGCQGRKEQAKSDEPMLWAWGDLSSAQQHRVIVKINESKNQ
jgi:hypothetical protein